MKFHIDQTEQTKKDLSFDSLYLLKLMAQMGDESVDGFLLFLLKDRFDQVYEGTKNRFLYVFARARAKLA